MTQEANDVLCTTKSSKYWTQELTPSICREQNLAWVHLKVRGKWTRLYINTEYADINDLVFDRIRDAVHLRRPKLWTCGGRRCFWTEGVLASSLIPELIAEIEELIRKYRKETEHEE